MVCQGNLKWGTANAIGVALVDLRMQSSTPAVVPGAALPRPRLGRAGGYIYRYENIWLKLSVPVEVHRDRKEGAR